MGCRARYVLAGIVLGMLGFATPAQADKPAPARSYKQVAPGNKFVCVMIAPGPVEEEVRLWNKETAADIREVRRTYTRSGMYRNDGSNDPLWTVNWYAHGVDLTPDGVHLIRPGGQWGALRADKTPDLDGEAVSFFANGRLLRTYRIGELVDAPGRFERSASHFRWQQEGRVSGEFEYTLTTLDGNRFVFEVRTGEIVSGWRTGRVWEGLLAFSVVAILVAVFVLAWFISRRRPRGLATEVEHS